MGVKGGLKVEGRVGATENPFPPGHCESLPAPTEKRETENDRKSVSMHALAQNRVGPHHIPNYTPK